MAVSPETTVGPPIRQRTGYLKLASINGVNVLITDGTFTQQNTFQYTHFGITPVIGFKQKTVHARGVTEVSFSLTGDLTQESASVFLQLLDSANRGTNFPVVIQQELPGIFLNSCLTEDITLTGAQNGIVTWSLSGKCLQLPTPAGKLTQIDFQHPIPAWASGAELVSTWSLSHKVALKATWRNNQRALPTYYRPGESEYSLSFTTLTELREHDRISIGVADILIIEGLVLRRVFNTGGRNEPLKFQAEVTNVNIRPANITKGPDVPREVPGVPLNLPSLHKEAILLEGGSLTPAVNITGGDDIPSLGINEIQQLEIVGEVTGGTYALAFKGEVTTPIPFDAPASLVQSSLQALSTIPLGSVSVTLGDEDTIWKVEFVGELASSNVDLLLTDGSLLEGTNGDIFVGTTQQGQHNLDQVLGWPDGI